MSTLHLTRGLPASGKTTWARAFVGGADPGSAIRLNRDDLRRSLVDPNYRRPVYAVEQRITAVQRQAAREALRDGVDVVVDDTNLRLKFARDWAALAAECGAEFVVHDFPVDVDECVGRDLLRDGAEQVGEDVIRDMHARFVAQLGSGPWPVITPRDEVRPWALPYNPPVGAPSAVMVDIDGTVALHEGVRSPYDTSRYGLDLPNRPVVGLVRDMRHLGERIVFCSGRDETFRDVTEQWLAYWVCPIGPEFRTALHMRPAGDVRNDAVVKLELFDQHIRDSYRVRFVLDDRDRVVKAWRWIGLTVLQVAEGNF